MPEQEMSTAAVSTSVLHQMPDGSSVELSRLRLRDFEQIKQECLRQYRRSMIDTWTSNADLLPEDKQEQLIIEAVQRAEAVRLEDLPKQRTELPQYEDDGKYKRDADGNVLTHIVEAPYEIWWLSSTPEGMLQAAWLSMRQCPGQENMTIDDVDKIFMDNQDQLGQVAQTVGDISESKLAKKDDPA